MTESPIYDPPLKNIRYADDGKIAFEYNGNTYFIKEPDDVILVGTDPKAACRWIIYRYGFLLS